MRREKENRKSGGVRSPRGVRKPSSALLAAALEGQSEGVLLVEREAGPEGCRIVFANARFCAIVGREARELTGKCHGIMHTDPAELEQLAAWVARGEAGTVHKGQGDLVRGVGSSFTAAWTFSPLAGGATHLVGIYRDLTEVRRMEEALVHSQRLDAVGRMAGGMAHDFNNLLSVINGYCQLLAGKVAGQPEALHDLEEINKAGVKAAFLTRQLLALGRRMPMQTRVFDMNQLLRERSEVLGRVVGDAGRLAWSLAPVPLPVEADPDQVQQTVLNLLLNAKDALRERGLVTLSTEQRELASKETKDGAEVPAGTYVVVSVADNGTGMDSETLAHVFEPFFTTKDPDKGSGLGLSLAYGVMQQSGGFIRVRSRLLLGSSFELYFPKAQARAQRESEQEAPLTPLAIRGHEAVLVVEEDAIVAKMVSGMLAFEGYQVRTVASPSELADRAPSLFGPPALLIAAIADSGECRRLMLELRQAQSGLRVLCTSACGATCQASGLGPLCEHVLPKPYAMSELLVAVRRVLDA